MTEKSPTKPAEGVSATLAVMDALIARADGAWGVRELAEHLGMSRTTTNRVLSQLSEEGLATKTADSSYAVGPRLSVLSSVLHRLYPVLDRGRAALDAIRRKTGGTVFMSVQAASGQSCFIALESESETPVRYRISPGDVLTTHAGAAGLTILAQLDESRWPDEVREFTKKTLVARDARNDFLRRVRSEGFAVSVEQHIKGAAGVAVPFAFGPTLKASVSVTRPVWEFQEDSVPEIVAALRENLEPLEKAAALAYKSAQRKKLVDSSEAARAASQVERVNQLLTFLVSHPCHPLTLKEVGWVVGAGSYAVTSLAEAAEQHGILCRGPDGSLYIGPTLFRWSATVGPAHSPKDLALGEMKHLSTMTGETVGLALLAENSRRLRMVQSVPGTNRIQYILDTPVDIPLHAGAAGKAVLAFAPQWLDEIELVPDAQQREIGVEELRAVLADVRAKGYAVAEGERIPQAFGVAAPIIVDGKIAGSITVTIPRYRVDRAKVGKIAEQVRQAANNLSRLFSIT